MRGLRRWSAEETDVRHEIALFRAAPGEILAERESAWAAELTPNLVVLGDPLPRRSALDAKHRTSLLTSASCACEGTWDGSGVKLQ
jgi:hypothetical protein